MLAGVGLQLVMLFKLRHWPAFRSALADVAACRWEAAHSTLLALEGKRTPTGRHPTAQVMLATLESLLGQPQQALDRIERAQPALAKLTASSRVLRCQAAAVRAAALATLGRFDDAWRVRDQLVREAAAATGGANRPRGDYLEMLVQATELKIAADADTPDALPDDDTLHRWARAALGRTRFRRDAGLPRVGVPPPRRRRHGPPPSRRGPLTHPPLVTGNNITPIARMGAGTRPRVGRSRTDIESPRPA